ncbi:DNA methyltransferase [Phormidium tenue]|jgi:DNA modification methylase|uniref:DNA methylase N-4/N-6 domain-containing protein n=1 Tax=Phormidium tenue FACHB-1050 TaxID=2692857 RepID=A0ABR8CE93_9CYAN|nr:site-specific DNA-methyltransferase [Phormidium tenue]MBD2319128.1 hypothetical protein [Phormidium tenue FACHB-1050]
MNFKNNSFFSSDALTMLERLSSDVVALTYLDPPHGNSYGLQDDIKTNKQVLEDLHTSYESYISKVVQQIHRILTYEGSLFVHWSQNSKSIDIRLIINQVFGKQPNYEINWNKRNRYNDFILVYSKSDNPIRNKLYRPLSTETILLYKMEDDRGVYRTTPLITNSERPSLQFNWRGYQLPPQKSWYFDFDKLEKLAQENRIDFPHSFNNLPRLKNYLAEHIGEEIGTTWNDLHEIISSSRERTNYPTQKPLILMERIIQLASNEGDQVLDPFCGTGTTLVAAQLLKRNWWGIDNSLDAQQITIKRLLTSNNLQSNKDYNVLNAREILELPIVGKSVYVDLIKRVSDITKLKNETVRLQQSVDQLTNFVLNIKKQINISEDDNNSERVEDAVKQIEDWITNSISYQSISIDHYISAVCLWLTIDRWEQLDIASQSFLPQAELLFENIEQTNSQDYSPFILQYCRALENELLIKLFTAYTDDLYNRCEDINAFLADDLKNEKTNKFAKLLKQRKSTYTLGDMNHIMGFLKANGETLNKSLLLQDFRGFTVKYFGESIVDVKYLNQIKRINEDFRCKAAHPYILDIEIAKRCRDQVRECINELILNYRDNPKI